MEQDQLQELLSAIDDVRTEIPEVSLSSVRDKLDEIISQLKTANDWLGTIASNTQ